MGFTDKQTRALGRAVSRSHVRSRTTDHGVELRYIEGWFALAQANRVFGFDGWDRETIDVQCLSRRDSRDSCAAVYAVRVRVSVRAGDRVVVREGHGTGEAFGPTIGEVHDRALKAAETDATKRALVTFGRAFGLSLYEGDRKAARQQPVVEVPLAKIDAGAPEAEAHDELRLKVNGSLVTSAIDKSALALSEPARLRDKEHLRRVASLPCLICGKQPSDAHHIRFAQPRALGRKVSDAYTVPLCREHHSALHSDGNESAWWHKLGIDPIEEAKVLWSGSQTTSA